MSLLPLPYPICCRFVQMRVRQEERRANIPFCHCVCFVSTSTCVRVNMTVCSQGFCGRLNGGLSVASSLRNRSVGRGIVMVIHVTIPIVLVVPEPIGSGVLIPVRLIIPSVSRLHTDRVIQQHQVFLLQIPNIHFLGIHCLREPFPLHRRPG